MGRLTRRMGIRGVLINYEHRTCESICRDRKEENCDGCLLQEVFDKLAHYEDMEEQGRLIEQKQGYWIKSRKYYDDGYTVIGACSVCGLEFQAKLLRKICYCPHCGAKMDEVENESE